MRDHLDANKSKMDEMSRGIDDLHSHYQQVSRVQIAKQQKEIDQLRSQKKEAIEEGDADRVEEIEGEMLDKYNSMESPPPKQPPAPAPQDVKAFDGWTAKNDWYSVQGRGGDSQMTAYADRMAEQPEYAALPYDRKLTAVTELVRKAFPEKFRTGAPQANAVESPQGSPGKRQFTERDLSGDQRSIMNNFVKRGIMTKKQYISDLADIGELG